MRLPNDHTAGTKVGSPTPKAYVADHDYALGLLVDAVSHSKFWKDTAIFVTEDDAQNGPDHIDAHRTLAPRSDAASLLDRAAARMTRAAARSSMAGPRPVPPPARARTRIRMPRAGYSMRMRILLTGWFSFLHGEATAGDVLSLERVRAALSDLPCDVAWSPVFRPGALTIEQARPEDYSHVVFICGPVHGRPVRGLHERYASCRRIAVGVSVIDPRDPAAAGFDHILARDAPGASPRRDLATLAPCAAVPVVGVVLAPGQGEYGTRRRHDGVHVRLTSWLNGRNCARLPLDTRLDQREWRSFATPDQLMSVIGRLDMVVTTRLHGLVMALLCGVPALAVDPVMGGAKVAAQATAWTWPAVVTAGDLSEDILDQWWEWCLSESGREMARVPVSDDGLIAELRGLLDPASPREKR